MRPDRGGKLFHAIVGLGLAAGCGGDVTTASGDGGLGHKAADASDSSVPHATPDSGARDAAQERTSAADVGTLPGLDAPGPVDAPGRVDATAMTVDAGMARDAASDVTIPPPPEIK
jgi:hypothetical protein